MKILPINDFIKSISLIDHGLLLSIDFGTKNIGLALSDDSLQFSRPFGNYERFPIQRNSNEAMNHASKYFSKIVIENNIKGFIIGFPVLDSGKLAPLGKEIIEFSQRLQLQIPEDNKIICTMWKENNSTALARGICRQLSNKRSLFLNRKDSLAAALILQSFLDHMNKKR